MDSVSTLPSTAPGPENASVVRLPTRSTRQEGRTAARAASVKDSLGLDDECYRQFYAFVEDILRQKGLFARTFRSISDREVIQKDISVIVLTSKASRSRFPVTIEKMRCREGQEAFRKLVYKINNNVRRRTRNLIQREDIGRTSTCTTAGTLQRTDEALVQSDDAASTGSTMDGCHRQEIVCVIRKDGSFKAVCRIRELLKGWPRGVTRNAATVKIDDLRLARLITILEADHAFEQSEDCLGWHNGPSNQPVTIDNERQWRAVIADKMATNQRLIFAIV